MTSEDSSISPRVDVLKEQKDDVGATAQQTLVKKPVKSPSKKKQKPLWRFKDGSKPNTLAIAYVLLGHTLALIFITSNSLILNVFGSLVLASALVVAGYMIHELAHGLVFYDKKHNRYLGEVMSWLCGSAYASFERIQHMHLRHHGDRADITCFDYQENIKKLPKWAYDLIFKLEWMHIPAVELLMHYQVLAGPFYRDHLKQQRPRVVINLISRLILFYWLASVSIWVLLFYALGYLLFLKAMYLGDAFAHTYEFYTIDKADEKVPDGGRNAEYDRKHTYSNIVSEKYPWLNLYNLNFGFHNAHHDKPSTPWYRLPQVQKELYEDDSEQYLPYRDVWKSFHQNRLNCILPEHEEGPAKEGSDRADHFLGVHGVSFLSIV